MELMLNGLCLQNSQGIKEQNFTIWPVAYFRIFCKFRNCENSMSIEQLWAAILDVSHIVVEHVKLQLLP